MNIQTVPTTILATAFTILILFPSAMCWDAAKYKDHPGFTFVSYWALFFWMWSVDIMLWYLVSISK